MEVVLAILDHFAPQPRQVLVSRLPAVLGRGQECEIHIDDPWMSRFHCMLSENEGRVMIRDMGSRNGVFVNGLRTSETVLFSGDQLTLGLTKVSVQYERAPASESGLAAALTTTEEATRPVAAGSAAAQATLSQTIVGTPTEPNPHVCHAAAD